MTEYEKLKRLIDKAEELCSKEIVSSDSEFKVWKLGVSRFINSRFGSDSLEMKGFINTRFTSIKLLPYLPISIQDQDQVNTCREGIRTTKEVLETYLEEIRRRGYYATNKYTT